MNKEIIISGVVGLILGVLVAPIFTSTIPWGGRMMYGDYIRSMMGGERTMGQIDSHFIEQMIPHHEDAITMANLALLYAEHFEIKTLANDIIRSQSAEISKMRDWYNSWFGEDVQDLNFSTGQGMMRGGMIGNGNDIKTLENVKPFDKEFIEQMIPHHQMAVMMAQMLLRSTIRPEMDELAENIISAQTKEINQMREWYRAWYEN